MEKTTKQKAYDDVLELVQAVTAKRAAVSQEQLETPPDPQFGDISFGCFALSKVFNKDPKIIAKHLSDLINNQLNAIKKQTLVKKTSAVGPYINFFVNTARFAKLLFKRIDRQKKQFGNSDEYKNKRVVVEYASPNTNKPLTLGHIRNIALGWSLAEILKTQGWKVYKAEIRNDRGAAICKAMIAWEKWGNGKTPKSENKKGDHFLGEYYVLFSKKLKNNPALAREIEDCLKKWEAGDRKTRKLWKKTQKWAINGIEETYKTLGADFDKVFYESDIYKNGVEIVKKGLKDGKLIKDKKGNIIAPLEKKYHIPDSILLRADKTAVYTTQDLYLAEAKYKQFKFDQSLYVVGAEQNLHFQQLFATFDLLGLPWAKKSKHISYALINLPEGRMKSREGTVVDADDLIEKVQDMAKEEIQARHKNISEKLLTKQSLQIALAAIKYYILQVDPKREMIYNPQESLSLQGRTGPYLQYMLVRIRSIIKMSKIKPGGKIDYKQLQTPLEHQLIILLGDFPEVLKQSAENYNPSLLAKYLYNLAKTFSAFYREHKVLDYENPKQTVARLKLITGIELVLEKGLRLLGIECPESM